MALFLSAGCALKSYFHRDVTVGMSPEKVKAIMGEPANIKTYPKDTYYFYNTAAIIFRNLEVVQVILVDSNFSQYLLQIDSFSGEGYNPKNSKYTIKPLNPKFEGNLEFEKLSKKLKTILAKLNYEFVDFNQADKLILIDTKIEEVTDSYTSTGVTIFGNNVAANENTSWANKSCIRKMSYLETNKSEYLKNSTSPKQINLINITSKGRNCNFQQVFPVFFIGIYNYLDFETETTTEMTVFSNDILVNK